MRTRSFLFLFAVFLLAGLFAWQAEGQQQAVRYIGQPGSIPVVIPAAASAAESVVSVTDTLTTLELDALPDGFDLIAAPGAGMWLLPTSISICYDAGDAMGTPTANANLDLMIGAETVAGVWEAFNDIITNAEVRCRIIAITATVPAESDDQPLRLKAAGNFPIITVTPTDGGMDWAVNDWFHCGDALAVCQVDTVMMGAIATASGVGGPTSEETSEEIAGAGARAIVLDGGGTGFMSDEVLTLDAMCDTDPTITVATVNASTGAIETFTLTTPGAGCMTGTAIALTGGSGSGATVDLTALTGTAAIVAYGRSLTDDGTQTMTVRVQYTTMEP